MVVLSLVSFVQLAVGSALVIVADVALSVFPDSMNETETETETTHKVNNSGIKSKQLTEATIQYQYADDY